MYIEKDKPHHVPQIPQPQDHLKVLQIPEVLHITVPEMEEVNAHLNFSPLYLQDHLKVLQILEVLHITIPKCLPHFFTSLLARSLQGLANIGGFAYPNPKREKDHARLTNRARYM
ncbi:hypothetical protein AMTR_s00008p00265740 [Amborella trichopoda]|uniref:Uncharacterized protein n=1 Tax=Amborella trichopoda TaxID=13333 RepID=W1NI57_AMBTC|nr:hypothetical protein AMTR_s00008p00265740 [Amborella trichopoda]